MAIELTSAQCRAARALLSWSQQDLAKAAQLATSTVADFERNARASAGPTMVSLRAVFEAKGLRFPAGGAVEADAPAVPAAGPGTALRWIDGTDLAQWAERRSGGQERLPQLISDLILAAYGPAAYIRMPSGDGVQHPGVDGLTKTAEARGRVPAGETAWEFGTQKRDKWDKAQTDYDKRTDNPGAIDRASATFIFVTARRWPDKDVWAKSQAEKGQWADVKAYDAEDLVHWLETTPGIGLRWAERIGRRPGGLRQLAEVFDEWSKATRPPLPAELLLVDRDGEAAATQAWLAAPASIRSVQAEAVGEAMAFLFASIDPYPEPFRSFWLNRCVVAETDDVARDLVGVGAKLVVVMNGGDAGLAQRLVEHGHHVFVAYGSEVGSPREVVRLPRLGRHELERALIDAEIADEKAHGLAAQAAGSLTVLRRLMPRTTTGAPAWAAKPSKALIAAMLVGAWCDDRPADRAILAQLAGMDYRDVVAELAPLATTLDGPIRRSGEVWKLASLLDAWQLLAATLTQEDLDRHAALFQTVMSREDPGFGSRLDTNWYFREPRPADAPVSGLVRRGLTEALIVMGAFPDPAGQFPGLSTHADRAVRTLLAEAGPVLWWSLQGDFQRLAEASPSVFLECLEEAIQRQDRPLAPLFESADGNYTTRRFHHGLLWALEILAWSPDYLLEAALRLAELDAFDRSDRKSNHPLGTLERILLPWTPQTFASADHRRQVTLTVLERHPQVGWALLRGLAPTGHGFALCGPKPTWRNFAPERPEVLSFSIVQDAHRWIGDALLDAVGEDLGRWRDLMEHWANFETEWRERAAAALSAVIDRAADREGRDPLREKIRDLVAQHRSFAEAEWAMPPADVDQLDGLRARLEPADLAARHAWLFESGRGHRAPGLSWQEARDQGEALQASAVRDIAAHDGSQALVAFALRARQTYAVGGAIWRAALSPEVIAEILEGVLDSSEPNADHLSLVLLSGLSQSDAGAVAERFDRAIADARPLHYALRLALALPAHPESWTRIDRAGPDVATAYWKAMTIHAIAEDVAVEAVIDRLIETDRIASAVCFAGHRLDKGQAITSTRLIALLEQAVPINRQSDIDNDALDFRDCVVDIFKHLDDQPEAQSALFILEWKWCGLLEHSDRPPRRLQAAMAESPEFFLQLLKFAYLPSAESGVTEEAPEGPALMTGVIDQAYRLLDEFSTIPGRDAAGTIDAAALETWVEAVRHDAQVCGRLGVADSTIGRMLASAPRAEAAAWPPPAICQLLERTRSDQLDTGFELGVYNRRGMTVRMPGDGGAQERVLVQRYRDDAKAAGARWPRVRRVLERIAQHYQQDAVRQDQAAERRNW
ncbi:hypothetical protein [Caulobacter sp.]|uniref:hypothetical protein n=1 Tax=Caulobacter sp. TaxID=78 RepID=UPI0031E312FF